MTESTGAAGNTLGADFPREGRVIGIDYGTKRVGVAISDQYQKIASPLHNYQRHSRLADEHFYRSAAREYEAVGLVVGLPVHMSGDESQKSGEARKYAAWLSKVTKLPVGFQDERYSSVQAEALMMQANLSPQQRHARIDMMAAQILLQEFMDRLAEETAADTPPLNPPPQAVQ
jgi:putative holliday junction resolvase